MAQRDYVKKSTGTKKKKKQNNRKVKNKSPKMPRIMLVLVTIMVILFASILYFVSTNNPKKSIPPIPNIGEKPQPTLPNKPEERWTYLKELGKVENDSSSGKQQQVIKQQDKERQQILNHFINDGIATPNTQIPSEQSQVVNTSSANSQISWILQCGAFKDNANAESAKAQLAMFGVKASIINDKLFRVIAEGFSSKIEAEKTKTNLENNGISGCILSPK